MKLSQEDFDLLLIGAVCIIAVLVLAAVIIMGG